MKLESEVVKKIKKIVEQSMKVVFDKEVKKILGK